MGNNKKLYQLICILSLLWGSTGLASDGVIEINQACVNSGGCFSGDNAGFPVTIGAPGSYILTSSLRGNHSSVAIEITADRVSLDLNGFSLTICPGICAIGDGFDAIQASGKVDIRIHNGTIQGSKQACIRVGDYAQLRNLNIRDCNTGLYTGSRAQISNVNVIDSESIGVHMRQGSLLSHSTVAGSGSYGIQIIDDVLIVDSVIQNNQGGIAIADITRDGAGGYRGSVFTSNSGTDEDQEYR